MAVNRLRYAVELIGATRDYLISLMSLPATNDNDDGRELDLRSRWNTRNVHAVDGDLQETIERYTAERWAVLVKPSEDPDDPIADSKQLFSAIYGEFPQLSFEIVKRDSELVYRVVTYSEGGAEDILNKIVALTSCDAEIEENPGLPVATDDHVMVSRLEYTRDYLFPLAHEDTIDYNEPYRALINQLVDEWDADSMVQVVIEPASRWTRRWARGVPLETGRRKWLFERPPERGDRRASMALAAILSIALVGWWKWIDHGLLTVIGPHPDPVTSLSRAALFTLGMMSIVGLWIAALIGHGFDFDRITAGKVAEILRDRRPTKSERKDIDPIRMQETSEGFRVSMRVLTTADDPKTTSAAHQSLSKVIRNSWSNPGTRQSLSSKTSGWRERPARKAIKQIAARKPHRNRRRQWSNKLLLKAVRKYPTYMSKTEISSLLRYPGRAAGGSSMIDFVVSDETGEPSGDTGGFSSSGSTAPDGVTTAIGNSSTSTETSTEPEESDPTPDRDKQEVKIDD